MTKVIKITAFLTVALAAQLASAECHTLENRASEAVLAFVAHNYGQNAANLCKSEMDFMNVIPIKDGIRQGSLYVYAFSRQRCRLSGMFHASYLKDNSSGKCINTSVYRGEQNNN
jgi:hypothetical protein